MGQSLGWKEAPVVELERPLFGQFARYILGLPSDELGACLIQQCEVGGRLGEIFLSRGLLNRRQVVEVLKSQARWVAAACQAENRKEIFPYPVFLSLCLPAY